MLLQATLAPSSVVSSLKSVCCDFSISSAVMPRSPALCLTWCGIPSYTHHLLLVVAVGKCPVRAAGSISLGVRRSAAAFTTTSGRLITDHVHAPSFVLYRRPGLDVLRIACEQPTGRLDRNDKKSLTRRQCLRRSMTQGRLHETSVSVVGQKGHNVRWPRRALLINRKRIKR